MARTLSVSPVAMTVALSTGLFATHTLVPPTPGPIAAAGNLGLEDNLGLDSDMGRVLTVMAVGAGAMTVSHANDSYFWVVSQFSKMDVATAYRSHTGATLFMGLVTISAVWLVSMVAL